MTTEWLALPAATFVALVVLERAWRVAPVAGNSLPDHALNLAGLAVQGLLVPLAGYWVAQAWLALRFPELAGSLRIGWLGAFLLNFVAVDFLYYWQHRLFHHLPPLWQLHRCHHASTLVNVWATSRNSLAVNFLFVYMLVNPLLGFLCDQPQGFFAAAAFTASLDLWRHSRLGDGRSPRWLSRWLITPSRHHLHHSPKGECANFGANLAVWDRLFGTACDADAYPSAYGTTGAQGPWRQFLFPW